MKKTTQYICTTALFLIPIFPLIVANSFFFPFITGKAFYFRVLIEIAFAAWIVLAFLDAKYRPRINALTVAVTLFVFIALLADLLGVNPIRSLWSNLERMEGWITIIHLWAFFIVATSLFGAGAEGKKLWHRWMNFSVVIATVVSLYGVGQLFGWLQIHQSAARVDATIGNSAYLAIYIVIHMFIVAYLFWCVRKDEFKGRQFLQWVYPILFILFGIIVLESQTRAAEIGLIAGLLLSLLLYTIFVGKEFKKSRRVTGIIFVALILLGVLFYAERKQPFFANDPIFSRLANLSLQEFKGEGRDYIWPMAIKGGLQRPILGWGQENFNYIFNANYAPQMYGQEQWFDRAHNVFLDWFVASGFVGLIAYLALYVLALIMIWKSNFSAAKKSILTGLITAYGVNNLAVFDNLASYVFFFAILAFISSLGYESTNYESTNYANATNGEKRNGKIFGENPVRMDAVEYIVVPITVILLIGVLYFFNIRPIQANTRLITALQACGNGQPDSTLFDSALAVNTYVANQEIREQLLSCAGQLIASPQVPDQLKQQFYVLAMKEIDAQMKATPKDARAYVLAGSFMNDIGQIDQALPLFERANQLSPNKQSIMIALADDYLSSDKNDQALELLKQAYESDTDDSDAKFSYAVGLVVAGKEALARSIFNNDPLIFETPQMANVYVSTKQYSKAIDLYKQLIVASSTDINLRGALAQAQYAAGLKDAAVATLQGIEKDHVEYKTQIDAMIKQIQSGK